FVGSNAARDAQRDQRHLSPRRRSSRPSVGGLRAARWSPSSRRPRAARRRAAAGAPARWLRRRIHTGCLSDFPSFECSYDGFGSRPHALCPCALGGDDGFQSPDRRLQFVIDDEIVVLRELINLAAGYGEPPLDLFVAVLAAAAQPLLENRRGWRQHKDADGLAASAPYLTGALDVDDEHHVLAIRQGRFGVRSRRSVVAAEHISPLEEGLFPDHGLEAFPTDEIIVDAVLLPGPCGSRRIGARHAQIGHALHEPLDKRRFAGA